MPSSKTYLNVPYAEKDQAKALGAKWDASIKKWYTPAGVDISQFGKWYSQTTEQASSVPNTPSTTTPDHRVGVFTQPTIKDFVGYNGDLPPWD